MRLWIVSPDPPLKAFSNLFERNGQQVVGFNSLLDEALGLLTEIQADVIVLNRYTPGTVTIAGAIWHIRSKRPDLRIVLLLGEDDRDARGIKAAAVSAGVYDWHVGRSIDSSIIEMIEKPRQFADVVGEVPPDAAQGASNMPETGSDLPTEQEPPPKNSRRIILPGLKIPEVKMPHFERGERKPRSVALSVPHLLYGVASPSPAVVFRTVQAFGTAWRVAGGDAVAVSLDSISDPWPAGGLRGATLYKFNRGILPWYGFGTAITQESYPVFDALHADMGFGTQVTQAVRGAYRRGTKGASVTILAFGNPWLDPVARAAWSLPDVLLLPTETAEDTAACAQWYALMASLEMVPTRVVSVVSREGRPIDGTSETWNVRDGWTSVVGQFLTMEGDERADA